MNTTHRILLFAVFWLVIHLHGQNPHQFEIATVFGGPLPERNVDHSSASLYPGVYLGMNIQLKGNQWISFHLTPGFLHRNFGYHYQKQADTLVSVAIADSTVKVPTYYTTRLNGFIVMGGPSLDIGLSFRTGNNFAFIAGVYGTAFLYKTDRARLRVRIGEGGLLPDIHESLSWNDKLHTREYGVYFGGRYRFSRKLEAGITGYRAFSGLYLHPEPLNGENLNLQLFWTFARVSLLYNLSSGIQSYRVEK